MGDQLPGKHYQMRNTRMVATPGEKKSSIFGIPEDTEQTGIACGVMNL